MVQLLNASSVTRRTTDVLHIGYVPLLDAAPLIVADQNGIFERQGLKVVLSKEPGWASIRDKIIYGELEAAHAIAGLTFAMSYGVGTLRQHCISAFLLSAQGDAITLSRELMEAGVKDAESLGVYAKTVRTNRPVVLASVHPFSSHHFLLRAWLRKAKLTLGREIQLVIIPPSVVVKNLELGTIDGFCVGEPWNTVAQESGCGRIVSTSADIAPLHPEKAFIVRKTFDESYRDEHLALIRALDEACAWCDDVDNRSELTETLSNSKYLGLSKSTLAASFATPLDEVPRGRHVFHRFDVNRPSAVKANWLLSEMRMAGLLEKVDLNHLPKTQSIFREDLYAEAVCRKPQPLSETCV